MNYDPRQPSDGKSEHSVNLTIRVPGGQVESAGAPYNKLLAYLLCVVGFVGPAGIHRFYLGKWGTGLLYLVTFGFFLIGTIWDLVNMRSLVRGANLREGYVAPKRFVVQGEDRRAPSGSRRRSGDLRVVLLEAARDNGGVLTVTQGVMASKRSFEDVERALNAMVDKGYVDVDNAPESGVVIYRFPDLQDTG